MYGTFTTTWNTRVWNNWSEVVLENDLNKKTISFHKTIREKYETIFPEKNLKISPMDKLWMTPQLNKVHRRTKSKYWKNKKN